MNAFSPLSKFAPDGQPTVINVNITIHGGVFHVEHPAAPEPAAVEEPVFAFETIPNVFYVNEEGLATLGMIPMALSFGPEDFGDAVPAAPQAPRQRPTVGRIVHYHPRSIERLHHGSKGAEPWAALITAVYELGDSDLVAVIAFPPGQPPFVPFESLRELPDGLVFDPDGVESFWSFPARA